MYILTITKTPPKFLERFSSSPYSNHAGFAQLLTVFMHYSPIHLFFSVISVYNLLDMLMHTHHVNGMNLYDCTALFLTAGINASLASNLIKAFSRIPTASVGASGAICGLAGALCTLNPNLQLTFPIIDQLIPVQFSAGSFLQCATFVELLGVLFFRYRSSIDHAAHLGGFLYGM
ncbi:Rho- GTP-binding protein RhoN [Cichlidogyrus casuarinus]|uniref:rhomboid protease n=1 Tax=Cichlidogyrus casuarinus TaxID=1844966 RepID=A0ABD2PYA3_9PLAT